MTTNWRVYDVTGVEGRNRKSSERVNVITVQVESFKLNGLEPGPPHNFDQELCQHKQCLVLN